MLNPFNILYPHFYDMISDDDYITSAISILKSQESIIEQNNSLRYQKLVIQPVVLVDIDSDNFSIQSLDGNNVSSKINSIFYGASWHTASYNDSIPKTDELYEYKNQVLYAQMYLVEPFIRRVITDSVEGDAFLISQPPIVKFEYLLNMQNGCHKTGNTDETVSSVDADNLILVTDKKTYQVLHADYISTLNANDVIPRHTILDKILTLSSDNGDIKVLIKSQFEEIADKIRALFNIKIEVV